MLFLLGLLLVVILIIIGVSTASNGSTHDAVSHKDIRSESDSQQKAHVRHTIENGDLPDWEDLSDDQKTKLSVWSEKGGPLEDLHLFDQ